MVANGLTDLSLTDHLALRRKLAAFRDDYQLTDKPALVWQCRPMTSVEVDVKSAALKEALGKGAVPVSDSAGWYAFRSGQLPTVVFDGLASSRDAEGQGWVAEIHTDGHIVAGLWTFPDVSIGEARSSCVSTFHGQAFTDFGVLAANLMEAADYEGQCEMTCTLLRASQLPFVQELDALPADAARVLLSTGKLVGEGFDHAPLDTLVLAMPLSWKGTLAQYAGRLRREHASKNSVRIVDFVDEEHPALLRMWNRRQRGYQAMGYRVIAQASSLFDPD